MRRHPSPRKRLAWAVRLALPVAAISLISLAALLRADSLGHEPHAAPAGRPVTRDWSPRRTPIVDVVRRTQEAVVNIHSERTARSARPDDAFNLSPTQGRVNGMGTGILIDPRGFILTNHHVVEDVHTLRVRLHDGSGYPARVLCRDPEFDLALLKIDAKGPLAVMPLGTSGDLMVGETVIAIGNAYGYEHSVTLGIISAINRDVTLNKEVSYKGLIQTDASINPGNSGGPLLNVFGELIGVNVAIRAGAQGIGFALPVDTVARVAAELLANAGVGTTWRVERRERRAAYTGRAVGARAATGISLRDEVRPRSENFSAPVGEAPPVRRAVVEAVDPDSPAARAGVKTGDVLVQAGDVPCVAALDLERALLDDQCRLRGGEKVALKFNREGSAVKVEVALEAVREPARADAASDRVAPVAGPAADAVWRRVGVRLQNVGPDTVSRTHPQLRGGMLVLEVREGSPAEHSGIQRNDILVGLGQWEMLSLDNVSYVLNHPDLATFQPVKFFILRSGTIHRGWVPLD